jgi:hypothetical protein
VLFFVGTVWLAGLVRLAEGCLVALARLLAFRLFVFIVGVLEMPKGPERTPCARWIYAVAGSSRESNSGSSAASSEALCLGRERLTAFRQRFCEYEYITSSLVIYYRCLTFCAC